MRNQVTKKVWKVDICIEQLEFKLSEWIGRQHGNQSKCQQPPNQQQA